MILKNCGDRLERKSTRMVYFQVVMHSDNLSSGTIDNATFKFDNNYVVKSVELKSFYMADTIATPQPGYLSVKMDGWPCNGATILPNSAVATPTTGGVFVVPLSPIAPIFSIGTFGILTTKFDAKGDSAPWGQTTVSLQIGGQEPGVGIGAWMMLLGIEGY